MSKTAVKTAKQARWPFPVIDIDRARMIERMNMAFGAVKYDLGAKPRFGKLPGADFHTSDCSGFVRWLLYAASGGKIKLEAGSWYQQKWCKDQGFKPVEYSEVAGLMDSRLRIAFINAEGGKVGHVWLIINGQTIECYGGHGAGRRPWDTTVLTNKVDACYVLTEPLV